MAWNPSNPPNQKPRNAITMAPMQWITNGEVGISSQLDAMGNSGSTITLHHEPYPGCTP